MARLKESAEAFGLEASNLGRGKQPETPPNPPTPGRGLPPPSPLGFPGAFLFFLKGAPLPKIGFPPWRRAFFRETTVFGGCVAIFFKATVLRLALHFS